MVINEIDKDKLVFDIDWHHALGMPDNTILYRESCECFMIVVRGGFLSYIDGSFRYRISEDFTPWTKRFEKFAIVDGDMIVRN